MDKEKVFSEGSERKEALVDHKNIPLKKTTKICIFLNGLVHVFCQKIETF